MRLQLALNVSDLDRAVDYYSALFGAEVHKRKPGYANFAIEQPPLKLVLFENPDADQRINHLGVEVFEQDQLDQAIDRVEAAGLVESREEQNVCCHARQNKIWSREPDSEADGDRLRWEWYRITDDAPRSPA